MRFSQLYAPTLKEAPSDADLVSIKLLIRGGFVRKNAAGVYTYLPLGLRVLKKVEQIVREEMAAIGCQEILMPIIQPAELWFESGRWDDYGPEMMKFKDRHERDFTLGPTHEELLTSIVRNELRSYRQFPLSLFQIANKYRDEIRPRFGLIRAREFLMKDAYSFHTDWESLDKAYKDFYKAYGRIMERIGLKYLVVEADTGAIGGDESHEFNALADTGESTLLYCDCGYAASDEKAEYMMLSDEDPDVQEEKALELVETPGVRTVQEVADFLKVTPEQIVKSLLYRGKEGFVMALIRGDQELNESKLKAHLKDQTLTMATLEEVLENFGVPIGFIGPVGMNDKVKIVADFTVKPLRNFVVGGMKEGYHYKGVCLGRDFSVDEWFDLKLAVEGDPCPKCGKPMKMTKGIELGHIFKLGTKYSEKMNGYFTDENGENHPYIMGCYGWGISRTMSAVVEQMHDEHGMIWPLSIAPFHIIITMVNPSQEQISKVGEELYELLKEKYEVLLDDRQASPGVKFKDADLIGIPLRITVGKKLTKGLIELKLRTEKQLVEVSISEGYDSVLETVEKLLKKYDPAKVAEVD
ncbi:proline--tRNA ligase [Kosmotoga sp.]|jgi:prolyl-tRNA synthetase|uniref:Proline--tRNA ligase n=1 Tax=Kosmotoga olearia (strain ATCC BAA-1733 / DSM 21960 / TBF 19.5.1) TaxID=521045 RepID=SYP_KOSOT|nr:RecName: Full=Proline--tRNA ligase; AltName: Full=Prolyl-tRNA synthetase; Short=ProRS [Kosmotoga olearia TBF 19.5.1]ACR80397.1 prolyl-tRNA synthetase [Kosmotoga olearia TBF 19.5.1]OAA19900.1 prolyl-tRNA synthetase [Kosmotoga sp. DU53]